MSQLRKVLGLLIAFITIPLAIAHYWVSNPENFPRVPAALWAFADSLYQSKNGEELADLEFLVIWLISLVLLSAAFFGSRKVIAMIRPH